MDNTERKELGLDEIKGLQLEIMDEIHAFCQENGISYFLAGGTLLGAIRHGGFIPWDDDIDIAMPRADYERFLDSFSSQSGRVEIMRADTHKGYCYTHAKAVHTATELVENTRNRCTLGVFIDIFPLDSVSGTKEDGIALVEKTITWKNVLTLKHLKVNKKRGFLKNAVVVCGKLLYIISDKWIIKHINKLAMTRTSEDAEFWCNFSGAWGVRELVSKKDFLNTELHAFENRKYCIPTGYDSYLCTIYGDYMTPPPPEKQKSHHDYKAYRK